MQTNFTYFLFCFSEKRFFFCLLLGFFLGGMGVRGDGWWLTEILGKRHGNELYLKQAN